MSYCLIHNRFSLIPDGSFSSLSFSRNLQNLPIYFRGMFFSSSYKCFWLSLHKSLYPVLNLFGSFSILLSIFLLSFVDSAISCVPFYAKRILYVALFPEIRKASDVLANLNVQRAKIWFLIKPSPSSSRIDMQDDNFSQ